MCGTSSDHVGLEEGALDDQVLVKHRLHDSAEDELRDASTLVDRVITVGKDLGLDDGHKTVLLADGAIAGKSVSGLTDGSHGWAAISNLENSSPLSEAAALGVEGGSASAQAIETLGSGLAVSAHDGDDSLVKLDASLNTAGAEELNQVLSRGTGLVDGLLIHDDT